eukprot:1159873-Pelagomonas_calceolata.AAC.6
MSTYDMPPGVSIWPTCALQPSSRRPACPSDAGYRCSPRARSSLQAMVAYATHSLSESARATNARGEVAPLSGLTAPDVRDFDWHAAVTPHFISPPGIAIIPSFCRLLFKFNCIITE